MMQNEIYKKKVKQIHDEERPHGIEGYERFKIRCVSEATKLARRTRKHDNKKKTAILQQIATMRKLLRWAETANIQIERGNKIKRRKRGIELLKSSNPTNWLGPTTETPLDTRVVETKAAAHLDTLIEQRDAMNEHKHMIRKKLEAMTAITEGELITPSFFHRMKTGHKKEEIFALLHEDGTDTETRVPEEIRAIASTFYMDL